MFKRIIVGVDEHEGGGDAIALAKALRADDGEVILVHVNVASDSRIFGTAGTVYEPVERRRGNELLDKARQDAGLDADRRYLRSTSVGRGLHELAEAEGADLLVLGSRRRGLLGRILVGDETRAALNGAPCAVAVAPAGYTSEQGTMREIGVGYDGSPESKAALELARSLAAETGAKLSAFRAISLPTYLFTGGPTPTEESIDEFVDEARKLLAELGGLEPHAAYGNAAEELAVYSASLDLLVAGSRGYGPLGRLFHGGTSGQLARVARCPLLVLARGVRKIPPVALADAEMAGRR